MSLAFSGPLLISLCLASGLWLTWWARPSRQRPTFSERIAPQLRSAQLQRSLTEETRDQVSEPGTVLIKVLLPIIQRISRTRIRGWGIVDTQALQRRLTRAGGGRDVLEYRTQQVLCSAAGLGLGVLVTTAGWISGRVGTFPGFLLVIASGCCGFLARDYGLSRDITRREKLMLSEFPALAELMALSVTAGESALAALERVCRCSSGELSSEFSRVLAETRTGNGIVEALQAFARRVDLTSLSRFVDGITVAIERGTPLAEVLRSQAQDVRDAAQRDLLEVAGKKEIAMLAPVVFLILPLTIIFAIYPGLTLITLGI